jgi:hypothetical protein
MPSTSATSSASSTVTALTGGGGSSPSAPSSPAAITALGASPLPYWRLLVTDLDGVHITTLDALARDRSITYELNTTTTIRGTVSSDSHEVNEIHTDGFPFLAEGDRLLYAFRRDYNGDPNAYPPWTIRAAGILLQYDDSATPDDSTTPFTAYDPWEYLNHLPIVNPNDSELTGNLNTRYVRTRVNDIIVSMLANAYAVYNTTWPPTSAVANFFLDWTNGTIETLPIIESITFPKGTTIGQAFRTLCERGHCDIVIDPLYDPVNFPGYLGRLNIYEFAGDERPESIFAWDKPSHSTATISRLVDGTRRKNVLRLHATQGGVSLSTDTEPASVARFGEYWSEEFLVAEEHTANLTEVEQEMIDTYSEHARTVSIGPIPERSPVPFLEWFLGDQVRVFASNNLRATMSGFQRISGFTLNISDDQLETVSDLRIYIPSESASS